MERIVELNNSLVSKLPLEIQSLLKSIPLSDYSLLLVAWAVGIVGVCWLYCSSKDSEYEPSVEFESAPANKKEVAVKVKIPNTKKARRGNKKKIFEQQAEEVKEETKGAFVEQREENGWEKVKVKKNKRKEE